MYRFVSINFVIIIIIIIIIIITSIYISGAIIKWMPPLKTIIMTRIRPTPTPAPNRIRTIACIATTTIWCIKTIIPILLTILIK